MPCGCGWEWMPITCSRQDEFQAAEHDFTRFSVIPSVSLLVDIPDKISGSWYDGDVHVLYKDS